MSQVPVIINGVFAGSREADENETCKHKNIEDTGDTCSQGCCDKYICKDCGRTIMIEVPD